jgi:hypothetical protein
MSIFTVIVCATLLVLALPAFADSTINFGQPTAPYTTLTTDFGGGDASGNFINSLESGGVGFTFSGPMQELSVSNSTTAPWASWNNPPFVENSAPNVLFDGALGIGNAGQNPFTLTLTGSYNTVGFELDPEATQVVPFTVVFYDGANVVGTINQSVNGTEGAELFALEDYTPGAEITSVVITDTTSGGDSQGFAFAQLRAGNLPSPVPEPGTLSLLALGTLALAKRAYRKVKA